MIPLLADENFNGRIFRALRSRSPALDLLRVQEIGLSGAQDEVILQWATDHDRILLTHDAQTIPALVHQRIAAGRMTSGVFVADPYIDPATAIEDILMISQCSAVAEWQDQVHFLPL